MVAKKTCLCSSSSEYLLRSLMYTSSGKSPKVLNKLALRTPEQNFGHFEKRYVPKNSKHALICMKLDVKYRGNK